MRVTSFNIHTYTDFYYREYLNCKTKSDVASAAHDIELNKWDYISKCTVEGKRVEQKNLFPGTYAVGARNKLDFASEDFEELSSRTVHMPEFYNEIHAASSIDPITAYIRDATRGLIYIGNSFVNYK